MQYYRMDEDGKKKTTDRQAKEEALKRIRRRNLIKIVWTLVIIGILAGGWFAFGKSYILPMISEKTTKATKEAVSSGKNVGGLFNRSKILDEEEQRLQNENNPPPVSNAPD